MNKKIFVAIILMLALFLSAYSLNNIVPTESVDYASHEEYNDILKKLKNDFPDATITEENGGYSVISENVDAASISNMDRGGISCGPVYESMEEVLESFQPLRDCVFIGEKTGETKQYIHINSAGQIDGIYYTESKVKVLNAFYGDISAGDVITLRESFAVFGSGENAKVLYIDAYPIANDEYFYSVSKNMSGKSIFGEPVYYQPFYEGSFKIETVRSNIENGVEFTYSSDIIDKDLYNKYIINEDTALDKESEIEKAQKWKEQMGTSLTEDELAKIDELCKKYGEVKK